MKVAVITRHAVFNYGSLLQTIATGQCLEDMGYECEIIDYQRKDEDYRTIARTLVKKNKKWNRNPVTRLIYCTMQSPKFRLMGRHFEKMREGVLKTTKRYSSYEELKKDKPAADIYMTGSDQVWGPIGVDSYDPAYFLGFVEEGDRKISYAASFGKTVFTENLLEAMKGYLTRYDGIAVREKSAAETISGMNVPASLYQVLDPTLLLDSEYWDKMIKEEYKEKYILIYQLHNNPRMLEYAYALAEEKGLPLVTMSSTAQHLAHNGSKHVFLPSLSEWLGYIKNAAFMITDSFHGTAFAINFNTQFVNVLPEGTATRNQSILELTGLKNRIVENYEDFSCFDQKIDFSKVNEIIEQQRAVSFQIWRELLENAAH